MVEFVRFWLVKSATPWGVTVKKILLISIGKLARAAFEQSLGPDFTIDAAPSIDAAVDRFHGQYEFIFLETDCLRLAGREADLGSLSALLDAGSGVPRADAGHGAAVRGRGRGASGISSSAGGGRASPAAGRLTALIAASHPVAPPTVRRALRCLP